MGQGRETREKKGKGRREGSKGEGREMEKSEGGKRRGRERKEGGRQGRMKGKEGGREAKEEEGKEVSQVLTSVRYSWCSNLVKLSLRS